MKKVLLIMLIVIALVASLISVPRNKVIVEIGTGTWCTYCPGAAMGADDLVENGHAVAIVEYHNGDTYANTASNARNTYYALTGYPTANFDGGSPSVGGSHTVSMYNNYLPKVNTRLAVASHFTITATGEEVDNNYSMNVVVTKTEADANTNLILHAAITESGIQQTWQGQTHLEFVERMMLPTHTGTSVNFETSQEVTVPLTFTMNPLWVVNNCEVVLFLQNNTTKEILQGTKYSFAELFGAYPVSVTSLNFPDTYLTNSATQTITLNNYWAYPVTGTIASDLAAFSVAPAARIDFTIPPHSSADYNVTFAPTAVGNATGNLTITSNFPDYGVIALPMTGLGFFNTAPVASAVSVTGIPVVSMNMTANYTFTDADANTEGNTMFQWYRLTAIPEPILIEGATNAIYKTIQADIGSTVVCNVTPVDQHGMAGTPVMSAPSAIIEALPSPQNLTATIQNEHDVMLDWDPPIHFARGFIGYRIFRSGLIINTITNPAITSFTDTWLADGDYEYWLTSVFDNPLSQSDPTPVINVHIGPVSNSDNYNTAIESVNIYPNPATLNSSILIKAKVNSNVKAEIYNTKGQLVKSLSGLTDAEGYSNLQLSASDRLLPGIYFLKVNSKQGNILHKFVLMR